MKLIITNIKVENQKLSWNEIYATPGIYRTTAGTILFINSDEVYWYNTTLQILESIPANHIWHENTFVKVTNLQLNYQG